MAEIDDPKLRKEYEAQVFQVTREMDKQRRMDPIGFAGSELETRYLDVLQGLRDSLAREDRISTPASATLGLSQVATGTLGDEISAGARALIPEHIAYPAMQVMGEKFDQIVDNPFEELSPINMIADAVTGDDEPSMYQRYKQIQEEQYPGGSTEFDQQPFMDRYFSFLERNRAINERARQEDPGAFFGGEVVGSVSPGSLLTSTVKKGMALAPQIPRLLTTGGAIGAGYGYGSSEGDPIATRLAGEDPTQADAQAFDDTMKGMLYGAGTSVALPLLAAGGRKVAQKFIPEDIRAQEFARQNVADQFEFDVERGFTSQAEAKRMLDVPEMTIADLGRETRRLADDVASSPTEASGLLYKHFEKRNVGTAGRMRDEVTTSLGRDSTNLAEANLQFFNDIGKEADKAYKLAYSRGIPMTAGMRKILDTPFGEDALRVARTERQNRGKNPDAVNKAGPMQSTRDMDQVLRAMNKQIQNIKQGTRAGDLQTAIDKRDKFERMLYAQNPDFAAARKQYGTDQTRARALDYGKNLFSKKKLPEQIELDMRSMSEQDKEMMRLGALEGLVNEMTFKGKSLDSMKGLWNRGDLNETLSLIVPDKKRYDQLIEHIDANREMYKTWTTVQKAADKDPMATDRARGWLSKVLELGAYTFGLQSTAGVGLARGTGAAGQAIGRAITGQRISDRERDLINRTGQLLLGNDLDALLTPNKVGGLLSQDVPQMLGTMPAGAIPALGPTQGEEYGFPEKPGILQ